MENKERIFLITIEENGTQTTIERKETIEELRRRIQCYKECNLKVLYILEKVITIKYNTIIV